MVLDSEDLGLCKPPQITPPQITPPPKFHPPSGRDFGQKNNTLGGYYLGGLHNIFKKHKIFGKNVKNYGKPKTVCGKEYPGVKLGF